MRGPSLPPPEKTTAKSRLLIAREEAELSIEQAAERLDWPTWMIASYESKKSSPPSVCLRRLADLYGVSVDWLRDEPAWEGK